jgi:Fe-S cluster assembly protein SufD
MSETRLVQIAKSGKHTFSVPDNASMEIAVLNAAPIDEGIFLQVEAKVGKNASLSLLCCHLGGKETKYDVKIAQQEGSRCEHVEVALLSGEQRMSARTRHLHADKGSYSRSTFRYAAAGSAMADLEGMVEIARSARGADAHFVAKSLLLSREARVRMVPQLSVKTGEVAAGHGAAMEPISADEIFYLESRGMEGAEARRMILAGFLLENAAGHAREGEVREALMGKMGGMDGI